MRGLTIKTLKKQFADEVDALILKVRNRRKNWKIKQAAYEKLVNGREEF
jgi:hypothetical protein